MHFSRFYAINLPLKIRKMHKGTLTEAEELPKPFCTAYTKVGKCVKTYAKIFRKTVAFRNLRCYNTPDI